ncbi:E3 ubiquitin-protein ligase KEG isoform X2 [Phalaenopsis equestris]|uniref:E3 ubiquitin-protein ligase KEG isoform X2 n=1 Tax=Phalaenopsis equestris TaxID=78828 RepID=UPI0009E2B14A|nr:E3 ubiquitin-protein ligase KEG isoform X2 [Phalaenopsis equestris]
MKVPCCSVCHLRYNEEERVPLLLDCGHGFCKSCLSRMFAASTDTTLSCPRCRHPTVVGNSVHALRKNFPILSLLSSSPTSPSFECDFTDGEDASVVAGTEDDEPAESEDEDDYFGSSRRPHRGRLSRASVSGCCSSSAGASCSPIDLTSHHDLKLLRRLGEGRSGQETWSAVLYGSSSVSSGAPSGSGGRCRHQVAVKRVPIADGMDVIWVQSRLDSLRRASMWCRNVCTFHGALRSDGYLSLIMDRYNSSVLAEMQQNKGRLTLEQILRYGADIARGVAELHAAGVVCMNLKPSNLLLDANGRAVVSDYGLPEILKKPCKKARSLPEESSSKMHSCMDCTMLSPHYTAPEAWEPLKKALNLFWDDGVGSVSGESDAWSFGCTLVEMCTSFVPWFGLSSEEIHRAVVKARSLPPQYASVVGVGIPRELWKMIGECLQFKASKRPTFHAMLAIFLRHLQGIPRSPPPSPENVMKILPTNAVEPSPTSVLEVFQANPNILHRLISEADLSAVREFLARAASKGDSNTICSLLESQNADGHAALHLACKQGSAELVETILAYKEADVDIVDKDGDPPLVFALAAGSHECVCALIRRSANVTHRLREGFGPSIAHVCAFHGQPECMRELLLAGADPNAVDDEGESVLHRAIAKRYSDCARVILENGGCRSMGILNSQRKTPLHLCIESWNVVVVRRWVEVASREEIDEAIDIPGPAGTALCMAAALKKDREAEGRELVRILLAAGADPVAQDELHGRTALHIGAMVNDAELVKIILEVGVDVNIRNVQNTTPLHVALNRGANQCIGLLLSAGADCNLQDDDGDNAFHIAADAAKMIRENLNWIVVMLQYPNADVEVRNHRGWKLRDFLEALPREWISEDLMETLASKGVHLSPTIYEVGDWLKFRRSLTAPKYGWQGAKHKSVGFVQSVLDHDNLIVSFCSGEAHVLKDEVIKIIPLNRGQHVQLKPDVVEPRFGWRRQSRDSIGTVLCVDDDGILRVGFPGASRGWRADPAEMERVEEFKVGDWVRIRPSLTAAIHGLEAVTPGSIGIVYSIRPDCSLLLGLCYLPSPWHCEPEEVEPVEPFRIGDQVCVKRSVAEPRYAWGGETHHSVGKITDIESDGLLIIDIPNRSSPWQADPSDMEKVESFKVGNWVRVKASVPSPKYGWEDVSRNSIGIIHSLEDDGDLGVAFCFRSKPFCCSVADMEKVPPFEIGQKIHIMPNISQPKLGWSNETAATIGKISRVDMDGTLNVRVAGRSNLWKVAPGDAERLSGFEVGDWVRLKPSLGSRPSYDWNSIGKDSIAVVHSIQDSGYLELAGCFRKGKCVAHYMDVEKVSCLKVGDYVRFRVGIAEPRWGWRGASRESAGIITGVHADGEVRVAFFGMAGLWKGDPADLEKENIFEVGDWVKLRDDAAVWRSLKPGSTGIVHGLEYESDIWNGKVQVSFCGEQDRWVGPSTELERFDKLVAGQRVRIMRCIKQPRFGWSGHSHASIGTISSIDADGKLRIYTPAGSKAWMIDPAEVDRVEEDEVCVGDWVRVRATVTTPTYQWGDVNPSSIGVVHRAEDAELWVSFCFSERLWICKEQEVEKVRAFRAGDRVRIRPGLKTPRWGWGMETSSSRGEVMGVDANGKLRIRFRWRDGRLWIGDPADIILEEEEEDDLSVANHSGNCSL